MEKKVKKDKRELKEETKVKDEAKESKTASQKKEVKPATDVKKSSKKEINEFVIRSRFLRISPSKVRLAAKLIKGMSLTEAEDQLNFLHKKASQFLLKMLKNAGSAAEHNYNQKKESLYIKNVLVNQGPTLHRFKPAARGAAHPIRKKTSHVELLVEVKKLEEKDKQETKKTKKIKAVTEKNSNKK